MAMAGMRALTIVAAMSIVFIGGAHAAELKIVDVKAYAFLEHAGKLSDDLVGRKSLVDAPKGGAPGGDTATGLLVDFTFEGDKNASPKYATATIDLTQTGHAVVEQFLRLMPVRWESSFSVFWPSAEPSCPGSSAHSRQGRPRN